MIYFDNKKPESFKPQYLHLELYPTETNLKLDKEDEKDEEDEEHSVIIIDIF